MHDGLLRSGMSSRMYTTFSIVHPRDLPNLTRDTVDAMLPEIPEDSVRHRHLVIFGMPESGKTTTMNWLAHRAINRYGKGKVNLVAVYSIADALDRMDSRPVQLLIIDDAVRKANSRRSAKQAEDVADFYEVRHIFESRSRSRSGVVITVWASQRFKSLDVVFRNAHALIFKTSAVDPDDARLIMKYIGSKAYRELERITYDIYHLADDEAKGRSLVHLPFAHRSGILKSNMREMILGFEDQNPAPVSKPFVFDVGALVQQYMEDRAWRKQARAYYLSRYENRTQEQISKDPQIKKDQATISRMIREMKGEISRVAGESYEQWKATELEARGYEVTRGGRNSEPDLVTITPEGKEVVYSCKCLEFDRVKRISVTELRPEITAALSRQAELVLSVYNLHDLTEQELRLDPGKLGKTVEIRPVEA